MPWSPSDAKRHKADMTAAECVVWSRVANAALKRYGNDARAIRAANSTVNRHRLKRGSRNPKKGFGHGGALPRRPLAHAMSHGDH